MASNIINITHEAGNINEYTGTVMTAAGDTLTANAAASMGSTNYGLEVYTGTVSAGNLTYAYKDFTEITSTEYRYRFYFDPNSQTAIGVTDRYICQAIKVSATRYSEVAVYWNAAGSTFKIIASLKDDGGTDRGTAYYAITDAPHYIEVRCKKATGASDNNAELELFVDGVSKEKRVNIDSYTGFPVSRMNVGIYYASMTGITFYLDEILFRDDGTAIGPTNRGTSALTLPITTLTASGIFKRTAASVLTLPIVTSTTSGILKHSGTSAPTLGICTLACEGTVTSGGKITGDSALTLPIVTLTTSGVNEHFGTSTLSLPIMTLSSSGIVKHFITSELNLPIVTLATSGINKHYATSELSLPIISLNSSGNFYITGTGELNLPIVSLNIENISKHIGTSDLNLFIPILTSDGIVKHFIDSDINLPIIELSSSGIVQHFITSEIELPIINIESNGINTHYGSCELILPEIIVDAASQGIIHGTSELSLPIVTTESFGFITHTIISDIILPVINLESSGIIQHFSISELNLPVIEISTNGINIHYVDSELNLPIVNLEGYGIFNRIGTGELSLPIITIESLGIVQHFSTSELLLPVINLESSGIYIYTHIGTSELNLPSISLYSSGIVIHTIISNLNLPEVILISDGIVKHIVISSNILPEITLFSEAILYPSKIYGTSNVILPIVSISSSGYLKHTIISIITLPKINLSSICELINKVRTNIRLNLQSQLKTITINNGYNINIGNVYLEPKSYEDIVNYPSCFPVIDKEEYIQFDVNGLMQKRLSINLNFMFKQINNPQQYASKIIADVEKLLMNNYSLTDKTLDIILNSNIQDLQKMTEDIYFLPVNFILVYKQNIYNPDSQNVGSLTSQNDLIPDTVNISLLENLKNAFVYNVQQMTTSRGNSFNYKSSTIQKDLDSIIEYPYCNFDLNENYVDQSQNGYLYKDVTLTANIYYSGVNNLMLSFDKIVADFEKRFLTYNYLPDSSGRRNCFLMLPKQNNLSYIEDNKPLGCVIFVFQVLYMNNLTNPKEV
jgi:hypothetical protein